MVDSVIDTNCVLRFLCPTGLGDTGTPLVYSLIFTALNAILDPIFIFCLRFGASGAAAGTAIAQYVALVPLLLALNRKVEIDVFGQLSKLERTLKRYLEAGAFVLVRTFGKVLAYSVCAREAVSNIVVLSTYLALASLNGTTLYSVVLLGGKILLTLFFMNSST